MSDQPQSIVVTATPPAEAELQKSNETATQLLEQINAVEITSPEDMVRAAELLVKVKRYAGEFGDRRDEIVKPLKEGIKNLEAVFSPVSKAFADGEKKAKTALVEYRDGVRADRREKEDELMAKVEAEEMTLDEAIAEMEKVPGLDKTIQTDAGKVQSRKTKTVEIVDSTLIPDEYFVVDNAKLRTDALGVGKDENGNQRQAKSIPGVKVGWKESLAV